MGDRKYLAEIKSLDELSTGTVFRRENSDKVQQGQFIRKHEDGGAIVVNVIDMNEQTFVAEAGIIKPEEGDYLYRHVSKFGESDKSERAEEVLTGWSLFGKNKNLQAEMLEFMRCSFSPEEVLYFKKHDSLASLFIPLQHRFKIGKFLELPDYDKIRLETFGSVLEGLNSGKHITYIGFIPREATQKAFFYTAGTKPHLESIKRLEREPFAFRANQGGHIKCIQEASEEGPKKFVVDAGSNDLGAGIHTSVNIAELVTDALKRLYPDHEYKPLAGRDAFGVQQSY